MPNPKYFANFPRNDITIDSTQRTITDISTAITVSADFAASAFPFYNYIVQEGERPDHVSYKHYGDSKYYWIILVMNGIQDLWKDWPLDQKAFDAMIVAKYGSVTTAKGTIKKYYNTTDNIEIDATEYASTAANERSTISVYDYEDQLNEAKREIKLIQREYLSEAQSELKKLFEGRN